MDAGDRPPASSPVSDLLLGPRNWIFFSAFEGSDIGNLFGFVRGVTLFRVALSFLSNLPIFRFETPERFSPHATREKPPPLHENPKIGNCSNTRRGTSSPPRRKNVNIRLVQKWGPIYQYELRFKSNCANLAPEHRLCRASKPVPTLLALHFKIMCHGKKILCFSLMQNSS